MGEGTDGAVPPRVRGLLLDGLAFGRDLTDLHAELGSFHHRGSSFPAQPLLELAADAFTLTGSTWDQPLELTGLTERHLPEWAPQGSTARQKHSYAITAAVIIAAGSEREDVGWWRNDDLWHHAFVAAVTFVRARCDRAGR